jgi:hypothetical protein
LCGKEFVLYLVSNAFTKFKPFTMRKISCLFIAGFLFVACNNDKKTSAAEDKTDTAAPDGTTELKQSPLQIAVKPYEKLLGSFVGPFGTNKITLLITVVAGDSVIGRSIVGGNDRPFRGTFSKEGSVYSFKALEPGDHKDDGAFLFSIDENMPDTVRGSWTPNDKKRPAKTYALSRRKFEYRTDVGTWPEASQRLLKPADVQNLFREELEFMRNEIFARHGYCFSKKHLRQQFEMEDWYVPNTIDIRGFLTDIEKKNIDLIKRYEKYAEEFGDEYGR